MRITTLVMGKEAHIWLAFVREREQELASYRDYECLVDIIAKDVFMIGRPVVMVTRLPHDDDFTTWETTVEIYHRWTDQSQTVVLLTGSLGTPTPWLKVPSNYVSRDRPICHRECRRSKVLAETRDNRRRPNHDSLASPLAQQEPYGTECIERYSSDSFGEVKTRFRQYN